ncbi:MAG TPA: aminotransferase class I/II-fold pyridoxal phosphate-dependent enzyme [Acidimicrobiales bacterium]|jgi:cystathionine beta-lyase|nr:aminotransferase class I/II-fold pyridoxal phosphate-dependent enzyme [Acidimicrobiales bacterium]
MGDLYPFDLKLADLRRRTSMKWRSVGPDVLPLWVAEMDVLPAGPVVEVVRAALERGDTGYAFGTDYAEAYAAFATTRWGCDGFDPARSALVADVMVGVIEILKLVTGPGDAVVVTPPVYPPFYSFIEHSGRRLVEVPLRSDGRLDIDALADTFSRVAHHGRTAFLLCSPHNPTGTVHSAGELESVAALAGAAGVRVVVDEIHAPLVLPGAAFTPYLSVPGADTGFAVVSASKGWNLPGLKAAVAFAGEAAATDLRALPEEVGHGPSHLGVLAHTAALQNGGEWLDTVVAGLDRNRSSLAQLLTAELPSVVWNPGAASYLAWLDFSSLATVTAHTDGRSSRGDVSVQTGVAAWLLEHARVLLSSGPAFGAGSRDCARINFATSTSILTEAVARIGAAVSNAG